MKEVQTMRLNLPMGESTQTILKKRGDAIGVSQRTIVLIHLYYMANKPIPITKKSINDFTRQKDEMEKVLIPISESLWEKYTKQVPYKVSLSLFLGYVLQTSLSGMDELWEGFEGIERDDVRLSNFHLSTSIKEGLKKAFAETNVNITGLVNVALLLEREKNASTAQKYMLQVERTQLGVRISPPLKSYLKSQAQINNVSMAAYLENTLKTFFKTLEIKTNKW